MIPDLYLCKTDFQMAQASASYCHLYWILSHDHRGIRWYLWWSTILCIFQAAVGLLKCGRRPSTWKTAGSQESWLSDLQGSLYPRTLALSTGLPELLGEHSWKSRLLRGPLEKVLKFLWASCPQSILAPWYGWVSADLTPSWENKTSWGSSWLRIIVPGSNGTGGVTEVGKDPVDSRKAWHLLCRGWGR